jgi:hypothetical protein
MNESLRTKWSVDRRYTEIVSAAVTRGQRPSLARDGARDQLVREHEALHPGAEVPAYIRELGQMKQEGDL